jgi:heparan-alpha-glucosaminide N-acetyltransferase
MAPRPPRRYDPPVTATTAVAPEPSTRTDSATSGARTSARILSIDVLRGVDVLLMLFVNEMAGVRGAPSFVLHAPPGSDRMTITDVVFPGFLFIVGLALPFALGGRLDRGEPKARVALHVLARVLALLVIGVLMVNAEEARSGGAVSPAAWTILMTVAVVLAWPAPVAPVADRTAHRRQRVLRTLGFALIAAAALLYHGEAPGLVQIRPHWWGILGLIGWAYLVAAVAYLAVGDRPGILAGGMSLLYCLYLADVAGEASWLSVVRPILSVGSVLGSHGAVVVSGTVLGILAKQASRAGRAPSLRFAARTLAYCAALAAAGLLLHALCGLHPAFTIDKPLATPPWCLLSSALTGAAWVAVYVAVDVWGVRRWPAAVTIAGENALVAYLLAPFLLALFAVLAPVFGRNPYAALGGNVWIGTLRSAVFAWLVARSCGWLRRSGVAMQL